MVIGSDVGGRVTRSGAAVYDFTLTADLEGEQESVTVGIQLDYVRPARGELSNFVYNPDKNLVETTGLPGQTVMNLDDPVRVAMAGPVTVACSGL